MLALPTGAQIVGWFFDAVMAGATRRFAQANDKPFATQEDRLRRILRANADTEIGREFGFRRMSSLAGTELWKTFRKEVPIRGYDAFAPAIERMKAGGADVLLPGRPEMFSLTSGTTAAPKFCPVTKAFIKEHHRQHLLWMYHVYRHHPRVNEGKYLVITSPAEMGRTDAGIPYGAMSGKQLATQSIPVRRRQAAPAELQTIADAEARRFATLLFAMTEANIRVVTAVNPATLLSLAKHMDKNTEALLDAMEHGFPAAPGGAPAPHIPYVPNPARARALREIHRANGALTPRDIWPELEILLTWQGGASALYLPHVAALWGGAPMRCLGLRASEGTFSIPLRDGDASGVLAVGGHVMEFVPGEAAEASPSAPTLLAGQLEKDRLYRLVATTSGGLYRYDLGDLVRVTGFRGRTPEVRFERRAGAVLSATGEKVTESQVVSAMEDAAANGPLVNGFTLTYEVDAAGGTRYVLALECTGGSDLSGGAGKRLRSRLEQLRSSFDFALMQSNIEYAAKREDGRIGVPKIVLLAEGGYDRLHASRAAEGRPESQIKPPVLVPPPLPAPLRVAAEL